MEITSRFYNTKSFNEALSTIPCRQEIARGFERIQKYILNPKNIASGTDQFISLLKSKKLAEDQYIIHDPKIDRNFGSIEDTGAPVSEADDLSYKAILKSVANQAKIKMLENFYNMYSSEFQSDAVWRLGSIIGTIEEFPNEQFNVSKSGEIFTKSDFNMSYEKYFISGNKSLSDENNYFASMLFPPYKLGKQITSKTSIMKDRNDDNSISEPFDQDSFLLKHEEFTYRDIGMKALSDNINYLQWLTERLTGVVSTYLTEWDLSLYMQEGLMTPKSGGGPLKIYLNYRIYDDNPLSNYVSGYSNYKALTFNVCGSAVSKLEFDCTKNWDPSDYPLSAWWMPYIRDIDWTMKSIKLNDFMGIDYMSIYDTTSSSFDYVATKDVKKIFRQQDDIGTIMSTRPRETLNYYNAFYTSCEDALTDFDIKFNNNIKKVAGAEAGFASANKIDIDCLIKNAREEMIMNGGYWGGPQAVGSNGGYLGRTAIKFAMNSSGSKVSASDMFGAAMAGANDADGLGVEDKTGANKTAVDTSVLDTDKNASVMSKMTGINRLSPALYGGPHGANYSPNNIRSWFEENSAIAYNIPRMYIGNWENITSTNTYLDKYYNNSEDMLGVGQSPSFNVKMAQEGIILNRATRPGDQYIPVKTWVYAGPNPTWPSVNANTGDLIYYTSNYSTQRYDYDNIYLVAPLEFGKYVFCREAIVYKKNTKPKYIDFNYDMPDAKWRIMHYTLPAYKANNNIASTFWNTIKKRYEKAKNLKSLSKYVKEEKAGFILQFDSSSVEADVKAMIQRNGSIRLFFCEGNIDRRYTEGPASIFSATCSIAYFMSEHQVWGWKTTGWLFWKKRKWVYKYTVHESVPFIQVTFDEKKDYFFDDLTATIPSNKDDDGQEETLYIKSNVTNMNPRKKYYSPIEKFHNLVDSKEMKSATTITFRNVYGGYQTYASSTGLTGIGILTGIHKVGTNDDLYKLPYRIKVGTSPIPGTTTYNERIADPGLSKAVGTILSRLCIYCYGERFPSIVSFQNLVRSYISLLLSEKSYIDLARQLITSIDFSNLRQILLNDVDRCVLKACGLSRSADDTKWESCEADPKHPLYNYWIVRAIKLFMEPAKYDSTKSAILKILADYDAYTETVREGCESLIGDTFTLNNIRTFNDFLIKGKRDFYERNLIDDFMFSYLNILYFYRLFFVGKRFNKEDGTMWCMRALESVLDFVVPLEETGAVSPRKFDDVPSSYPVAFYEVQNTLDMKRAVMINKDSEPLAVDKIFRIYVKVQYGTIEDWNAWTAYQTDSVNNPKAPEIIRVYYKGHYRYIKKPTDGMYMFRSKEYDSNEKNIRWNKRHPDEQAKKVEETNTSVFNITWRNDASNTPIRWNVFGTINADNMLEYANEGIQGQDLICLIEEGADFWTIDIPAGQWARKALYKSGLYILQVVEKEPTIVNASQTVLGPFANTVSPIIRTNKPGPTATLSVLQTFKQES